MQQSVQQLVSEGMRLHQQGMLPQAEQLYQRALAQASPQEPGYADALHLLGVVIFQMDRPTEALPWVEQAVHARPDVAAFWNSYGNVLKALGRIEQAVAAYQKSLVADPDFATACHNLGQLLTQVGQIAAAEETFRYMIDRQLRHARQRPAESLKVFEEAILRLPQSADAHWGRGMCLSAQTRSAEAEEAYCHARELQPQSKLIHSARVKQMNYLEHPPDEVYAAHVEWGRQHGPREIPGPRTYANSRDPARRLRVGYVSPDFRQHSIMYFIEPILAGHDRQGFEVFCYADERGADDQTVRLRSLANTWRNMTAWSDEELASYVRADQVDILVDLAGHFGWGRLGAFALKPAPIQVTYLGYPNTTGLKAVDYRITDAIADLVGETEQWHTEELIRPNRCFLCYRPDAKTPAVAELPAAQSQMLTFCSFNNLAKITPAVMQIWGKMLMKVPQARLAIKNRSFGEQATCHVVRGLLANAGVPVDRVELVCGQARHEDHLALYNRADIALDSFPYNGTTTTCEALWMGVPVVTLAGQVHAGRVGASLLSAVGLGELVANDLEKYIAIAVRLANDIERLKELRRGMRERMQKSPLMDEAGFVRRLEEAYRKMWTRWCAS